MARAFQTRLASFTLLLMACALAIAEPRQVGSTTFARGAVAAQLGDRDPRMLNKGAPVYEQDFIEAGPQSFAVITFVDGAKLTIRPNSAISVDEYQGTVGQEAAQITLQQGGIRATSGTIAERRPGGMLVHAAQATVEVHGASFDARLCEQDCAQEEEQNRKQGGTATDAITEKPGRDVVGRVGLLRGKLFATGEGLPERVLRLGGSLYVKDQLRTSASSHALLVFRDGERITLQQETSFLVASRNYEEGKPQTGEAGYRLLRGGMRALTGKITKGKKDGYQVATPVATTGIRGTLYDHHCEGDCSSEQQPRGDDLNRLMVEESAPRPEGLYSVVHQGGIDQFNTAGTFPMDAGNANYIANNLATPVLLRDIPLFMKNNPAPRPDQVEVDMNRLFGLAPLRGSPPGLYVHTREGHVRLRHASAEGEYVDLGRDETGYQGPATSEKPIRLERGRLFLEQDSYPDPDFSDLGALDSKYSILSGDPEKPESFSCVCPI